MEHYDEEYETEIEIPRLEKLERPASLESLEFPEESGVTLASLHDELMAGTSEARRGNRRTLDVLKNFGSVLDSLSSMMAETHKATRLASAATAASDALSRDWALALVEMADRSARISDGFSRTPVSGGGWWPAARKRQAAWADAWAMQADALDIFNSHLDSLLSRAGLERLRTIGQPFDPAVMTAVESAPDADHPDHTVLAEILAGWRRTATNELLRPAQVRVSRRPAN